MSEPQSWYFGEGKKRHMVRREARNRILVFYCGMAASRYSRWIEASSHEPTCLLCLRAKKRDAA